jgi:bifunctional DNase/RNase
MSEVRVVGIAVDSAGQRVILLKAVDEVPGSGKILPIWIGTQEAMSILVAIEGAQVPRPLAHDLMVSIIDSLEARVDRVEISSIDEGTFFAAVTLVAVDGVHVVDARPSDAIALASRTGSRIYVADEVLLAAGIPDTVTGRPGPDGEESDPDGSLDEFREFLDTVDPEDFRE